MQRPAVLSSFCLMKGEQKTGGMRWCTNPPDESFTRSSSKRKRVRVAVHSRSEGDGSKQSSHWLFSVRRKEPGKLQSGVLHVQDLHARLWADGNRSTQF